MVSWVKDKVPTDSAAGKEAAACGSNTASRPEDSLHLRFASHLHGEIISPLGFGAPIGRLMP